MRCVKKGVFIHISTSPFSSDVGCHNHPLLGPSVPAGDPHGITPFLASQQVPAGNHHGLVHAPPISGWGMALIPFVMPTPNDAILSAFGSPEPVFPGGHPSWYYSRRSTLNCGVLIGSWSSRL